MTLPPPETVWMSGCPRSYSLFHSLVFEMYRLNTQTNPGLFHRYVHHLSLRPHPRVVHMHPHRPLPEIQPRSRYIYCPCVLHVTLLHNTHGMDTPVRSYDFKQWDGHRTEHERGLVGRLCGSRRRHQWYLFSLFFSFIKLNPNPTTGLPGQLDRYSRGSPHPSLQLPLRSPVILCQRR